MLRPCSGLAGAASAPLALALACTAACGAQLDGGPDDTGRDAMARPDAPIDARPCTGGDARMSSPTGACFFLFHGPATYADAGAGCASSGGRLAILRNTQDDAVARTLVGAATAFLGLTDQVLEGNFVWSDGSTPIYTNWYPGEPNDGSGSYPEDCAVLTGGRAGLWDDRPCAPDVIPDSGLYAYLCES